MQAGKAGARCEFVIFDDEFVILTVFEMWLCCLYVHCKVVFLFCLLFIVEPWFLPVVKYCSNIICFTCRIVVNSIAVSLKYGYNNLARCVCLVRCQLKFNIFVRYDMPFIQPIHHSKPNITCLLKWCWCVWQSSSGKCNWCAWHSRGGKWRGCVRHSRVGKCYRYAWHTNGAKYTGVPEIFFDVFFYATCR